MEHDLEGEFKLKLVIITYSESEAYNLYNEYSCKKDLVLGEMKNDIDMELKRFENELMFVQNNVFEMLTLLK